MTVRAALTWICVWIATVSAALFLRPLLPVDETRYLAVAWEMWRDNQFIVPHLAGEPYSHKPPLLFWSMHLGWAAFGVTDWWPRLVAPLYALAALLLTRAIGRRLWPDDRLAVAWSPAILAGLLYWTLFSTVTFFDMPLAVAALTGLLGILKAVRNADGRDSWHPARSGFLLMGVGIGIGILAKGPAILLHILPVALCAPLWASAVTGRRPVQGWRGWYGGVLMGLGLGVVIGLAWAVPAGVLGGEAYRDAIFWGQSAGRMVNSFAHARPWWWFAAILPAMVLPWTIWPGLWKAAWKAGRGALADGGVRLCLIWFAVAFLAFSLISGKQPHYLLPEFPALALLAARVLSGRAEATTTRFGLLPVAALLGLFGLAVIALPILPLGEDAAMEVSLTQPWWGLLIAAAAAGLAFLPPATVGGRVFALSLAAGVVVVAAHLVLHPLLSIRHDVTPAARHVAELEKQGYALAFFTNYHGQLDFAGRLTTKVHQIAMNSGDIEAFLAAYPKAKIIGYRRDDQPPETFEARFPYRGGALYVWDRALLAANPRALHID